MPGRRVRDESAITGTATTVPAVTQRNAATRSVRARRGGPPGYPGYVNPADRLQTVENDPQLLALPSAYFAQRTWMLANAHKLRLEAEWQKIKLFYITMTDFAKLQKSLDREVNPLEVSLEPWVAMIRDNMMVRIAQSRMTEGTLIQFDVLHESLRIRIEEGRVGDVTAAMAEIRALFDDHAKLWLDYNACIPVPYRLKMGELFSWAMEKLVTRREVGLGLDGGIFRREAVPEIMDHVVKVYCES